MVMGIKLHGLKVDAYYMIIRIDQDEENRSGLSKPLRMIRPD